MSGVFGPLSDLFFWVLRFLHENVGVSWSWSIVLLTVIVRIVLIPLTWRQLKSMRALQALQPQLKALQEKYKHDRQLLNQKMMEFYQQNNVSPFGSCLPLLLQLPVFIGLFYMLRYQGQAVFWDPKASTWLIPPHVGAFASVWHSAPVGWLWIHDITKFDIGLMFLYIASQFFASWQMARRTGGQQKIIAYAMPIMVGIFMYVYKWPAGLFIYWFTSNLWTIAQQYVAEKFMPVPVPAGAALGQEKGTPGGPSGRPGAAKRSAASGKTKRSAAPGKAAPVKRSGGAGKSAPTSGVAPSPGAASASGSTPASGSGTGQRGSGSPAKKSGGKSSGQRTGQQSKAARGESQRPDSGAGGPEGAGGT